MIIQSADDVDNKERDGTNKELLVHHMGERIKETLVTCSCELVVVDFD